MTSYQTVSDAREDAAIYVQSPQPHYRRRYNLLNKPLGGKSNDNSFRFISMTILTSIMMLAEIIAGVMTGSLTLLSDAFHMISDVIALIIGFIADRLTNGAQEDKQSKIHHTMVYMRYEVVAALINGAILLTSCFIMTLEAIKGITLNPVPMANVDLVLIVGGLGLFINSVGLFAFGHHHHGHSHGHSHGDHHHEHSHGHSQSHKHGHECNDEHEHDHEEDHEDEHNDHEHLIVNDHHHGQEHDHEESHHHEHDHHEHEHEHNLNMHGVFLHMLADVLGSITVIISACVIKFTDGWWNLYVDPACTIFIVLLISKTAVPLVKQSMDILLNKSPFSPEKTVNIQRHLQDISGVLNIHEFHCWEVNIGYYMAQLHVIIDPEWNDYDHTDNYCQNECDIVHNKMTIIDQIKRILHEYDIHSSVIQPEFADKNDDKWKKGSVSCFDPVCDSKDCIKKSVALSNHDSSPSSSDTNDEEKEWTESLNRV